MSESTKRGTRLLCTLGPASLDARTIRRLTEIGVDLFRLNLSHTDPELLPSMVGLIRANSDVPICFDTQGAQIRTGTFTGGSVQLAADSVVELAAWPDEGDEQHVPLYPGPVPGQLAVGDLVSLDFHSAVLQVIETGGRSRARVLCAGRVGSNKAASVDRRLRLAPLTDVDRRALSLATELGIRHVALSFANRRADVDLVRDLVGPGGCLIAKIESREGLSNLDDILGTADEILIDRGDLSREVPIESIPLIQKDVIQRANAAGVPVHVATNLLESMVSSTQPTRAEVNDVMNTLIDGADGLVLAAETAIGAHPIGCAAMIRSLIGQFEHRRTGGAGWLPSTAGLPAPLGGSLILRECEIPADDLDRLPLLDLDNRVELDVRQIARGAFSPLDGFMGRESLASVLATHRLLDGTVWPMPVLLQLPHGLSPSELPSGPVRLAHQGRVYAVLVIDEVFQWELRDLAARWFGSDQVSHPGVAQLQMGSDWFIGGTVCLLPESTRLPFELTPAQARVIFAQRQWRKVVGFHTRNVPHRVHEHLQLTALADQNADGVFIHPVVGPKKSGDCHGEIVVRAYQLLIDRYYPANTALVAGFATYSRYAGPREAVFTAICRQNFGCSHFIVGRDHTGVGQFYSPDASRRLLEHVAADLGIQFVFADEIAFCRGCGTYRHSCNHDRDLLASVSGTEARTLLQQGSAPPDWYMRESVSAFVLDELGRGTEVFVP